MVYISIADITSDVNEFPADIPSMVGGKTAAHPIQSAAIAASPKSKKSKINSLNRPLDFNDLVALTLETTQVTHIIKRFSHPNLATLLQDQSQNPDILELVIITMGDFCRKRTGLESTDFLTSNMRILIERNVFHKIPDLIQQLPKSRATARPSITERLQQLTESLFFILTECTMLSKVPGDHRITAEFLVILRGMYQFAKLFKFKASDIVAAKTPIVDLKAKETMKTSSDQLSPMKNKQQLAKCMAKMSPPEDYRCLNIVPHYQDIFIKSEPFVRPNIIDKSYPDAKTYLDIQFRLLREDFYYPFRQGILSYRQQEGSKVKDIKADGIHLHHGVRILYKDKSDYHLQFSPPLLKEAEWEESKRLIYGSLVCLTTDGFKTLNFFTVVESDPVELAKGRVILKREGGRVPQLNQPYLMAESAAYFGVYRNVLQELQEIKLDHFPLRDIILGRCTNSVEPDYLAFNKKPIFDLSVVCSEPSPKGKFLSKVDIRQTSSRPSCNDLGVNPSQCDALYAALTRKVTIIQGPPGTGKSFIGLKIVQTLLHNSHLWRDGRPVPILIVGFTNHALDQFLEHMLPFTRKIVRVGSQSKCPALEPYLLNEMKRKARVRKEKINEFNLCKGADILGMTTTGAANKKQLLEKLGPKIVVVEEAAEVLEAHIVAALTSTSEQLILIGDHKQLRPNTSTHHLAKDYHLDVSLFERLVNNGAQSICMNVQHRMRPEVARLISPAIYPTLKNDASVCLYPPVRGLKSSVFFLTHTRPEEVQKGGKSRLNPYEVDMSLALALHLLRQDYRPQQITILTTYSGQLHEFKVKASLNPMFSGMHITTVDSYQGEENDIIILSLVRSNPANKIGFLKIENRVCVAMSRAKQGFYLVGNMTALEKKSSLWRQIQAVLQKEGEIGTKFLLKCQAHGTVTKVKHHLAFPALGGCKKTCSLPLDCGHKCPKYCHGINVSHTNVQCFQPCLRSCSQGHPCAQKCFIKKCKPCSTQVLKSLPCGHSKMVACHLNPKKIKCGKTCI